MGVTLTVDEVKAVTEKALLCDIDGEEHWIPISQIKDYEEMLIGDTGDIVVSKWIATQKGLYEGD